MYVPSPRIPQYVAGLWRSVGDHVAALRCGSPDIDVTGLALDGAVAIYREAERAEKEPDLSDAHVDRVARQLYRTFDAKNRAEDPQHDFTRMLREYVVWRPIVEQWRAVAREAIRLGAVIAVEEVP
jgi:hypothetical protein